jgi:hypothetical protein
MLGKLLRVVTVDSTVKDQTTVVELNLEIPDPPAEPGTH